MDNQISPITISDGRSTHFQVLFSTFPTIGTQYIPNILLRILLTTSKSRVLSWKYLLADHLAKAEMLVKLR